MSTIEKAIEIATHAHAGFKEKAGAPYIFHPLRLMLAVNTPVEQIVAVLHDTIEDTYVTRKLLEFEGFTDEVIDAVEALTKREGESRLDAAARAVANPIARIVKLADVTDNMDLSRIPNLTEKDFTRLKEYKEVKRLLEAGPLT